MRISKLAISHFRAISETEIELQPLTSIIGSNNSGKSAFLKALDLFFSNSPKVEEEDFHNKDTSKPIDITVTFSDFTSEERELFQSNLIDGALTVTRRLIAGSAKDSGSFFVEALANPEFTECRNATSKTDKRIQFQSLQEKYGDLANVRNADEIDERLEAWEQANPDALKRIRVGSFRGWKNVAAGQIKKKTDFVFVPAVREASKDTTENKSPAKQLIDALARQTIENNQHFKDFLVDANSRLAQFTDPANVPALKQFGESLSAILRQYYSESSLIATWQPISQLPIEFPTAEISVQDHGFCSSVERVGHGLQRAVILTILEFLARERFKGDEQEFESPQSDIFIAIEEPEIYQHPTKQRHIARVLSELATSFSKKTGIRLQLLIATHSRLFVQLPKFEEVRIARREPAAPYNVKISKLSITACSSALAQLHSPSRAPMSDNAFAAKLHIFSSEVSEGFFAKKVVLVEGASDKAVLEAAYQNVGRSPLSEGICIIDVGGKKKLDKPAYIFSALKIPVYVLMDNDRTSTASKGASVIAAEKIYNRFIQKIMGLEESEIRDFPTEIGPRLGCWDGNLQKFLIEKCGTELYDSVKREMMTNFEVDGDDCVKSPAITRSMIARFRDANIDLKEIYDVIQAIDGLGGV